MKPSQEALEAAREIADMCATSIGKAHDTDLHGPQCMFCTHLAQRIDAAADARSKRLREAARPFVEFAAHMEAVPRRGMHDEIYGLDNAVFIRQSDLKELRAALAELEGRNG